ncbi:hypothetical protein L7F22_010753 [Adiantum nelumboides]|nr:hypothetical protein [Adiantum nelumboides]
MIMHTKGIRLVAQWVAKKHMHGAIKDPNMRQKLEPNYQIGCKRVLLSSLFYPALARPNVELITDHILEVRETEILFSTGGQNGCSHATDIIIYATGFDLLPSLRIVGNSGLEYNQEGYSSLLGTTKHGFPNFFTLLGFNTGTPQLVAIEAQMRYTMSCLSLMGRSARSIEPRGASEHQYQEFLARRTPTTVWASGGCRSWYLDSKTGYLFTLWPDSTLKLMYILRSAKPSDYCIK